MAQAANTDDPNAIRRLHAELQHRVEYSEASAKQWSGWFELQGRGKGSAKLQWQRTRLAKPPCLWTIVRSCSEQRSPDRRGGAMTDSSDDGAPPGDSANVISFESARRERERRREIKRVRDPNGPRPPIRLAPGEIERIVDESELALIKADRGLYQRDGLVVSVVATPAIAAHGREISTQRVAECGDYSLLEHLTRAAIFERLDGRAKDYLVADPPAWVVKTLRQRHGKLRFPILTGVDNASGRFDPLHAGV
jgi:hypothetical protein